jgi:hypothetical protein
VGGYHNNEDIYSHSHSHPPKLLLAVTHVKDVTLLAFVKSCLIKAHTTSKKEVRPSWICMCYLSSSLPHNAVSPLHTPIRIVPELLRTPWPFVKNNGERSLHFWSQSVTWERQNPWLHGVDRDLSTGLLQMSQSAVV